MRVGVVRETKIDENRVALTPSGAHALVDDGAEVLVESGAGLGSRIDDAEYLAAGAKVVETAADVWSSADIVVKVKEPQEAEFGYLREDLTLFTYLHLAAYPLVAAALTESGTTAIAYETVQLPDRSLPLLAPMSEVAGRMSVQVGARFLESYAGGRGILLGGVPGVEPATVIIIGGGVAGSNAAQMAFGMGADVHVYDMSPVPLRAIDKQYHGAVKTRVASPFDIKNAAAHADSDPHSDAHAQHERRQRRWWLDECRRDRRPRRTAAVEKTLRPKKTSRRRAGGREHRATGVAF